MQLLFRGNFTSNQKYMMVFIISCRNKSYAVADEKSYEKGSKFNIWYEWHSNVIKLSKKNGYVRNCNKDNFLPIINNATNSALSKSNKMKKKIKYCTKGENDGIYHFDWGKRYMKNEVEPSNDNT